MPWTLKAVPRFARAPDKYALRKVFIVSTRKGGGAVMGLTTNRLKEFRERLGWTQEGLAGRVRVSRQTINSIEVSSFDVGLYE
jgi:predicted transcriptional regulator